MKIDPIQSAGEAMPTENLAITEAYKLRQKRLQHALEIDLGRDIANCVQELMDMREQLPQSDQDDLDELLSSNPVVWGLRRASGDPVRCPLRNMLLDFKDADKRFSAMPDFQSDEETVVYEAMISPLWDQIKFDTPICTSSEGAALAMQIGAKDLDGNIGGCGLALVAEAFRFYRRAEL